MFLINADMSTNVDINGIAEPIICKYFTQLNNSEFAATAALFAEQGYLNPPFEKMIQGKDAIAQYLDKEAIGIKYYPEQGEILFSNSLITRYKIEGKVQTNHFMVNVSWLIELNNIKEIMVVDIKLLASLNELLNFRNS